MATPWITRGYFSKSREKIYQTSFGRIETSDKNGLLK